MYNYFFSVRRHPYPQCDALDDMNLKIKSLYEYLCLYYVSQTKY
jgi:hypothetical protein